MFHLVDKHIPTVKFDRCQQPLFDTFLLKQVCQTKIKSIQSITVKKTYFRWISWELLTEFAQPIVSIATHERQSIWLWQYILLFIHIIMFTKDNLSWLHYIVSLSLRIHSIHTLQRINLWIHDYVLWFVYCQSCEMRIHSSDNAIPNVNTTML